MSRFLPVEEYGTYKQLVLIQALCLLTVQMGLDAGLFYFIRRNPTQASIYSLNAVAAETLICVVLAVGLWLAGPVLGERLHNPSLARYLPAFGCLLVLSVPAQHFEHYLTVLDRIGHSVRVAVLQELGKAAAVIGGFWFYHSLEVVLYGMAAVSGLKLLALVRFNLARREHAPLGERYARFREQWRFALPLGLTNLLNAFFKLDKFVVSAMFSLRQFTIYSVGCFDVPLLTNVGMTLADLMSFDMVSAEREGQWAKIQTLWRETRLKCAAIQLPAVCFLVVFADAIIPFLFSDKYLESGQYFRVFALTLFLLPFDSDILFRTFARNRLHLKLTLAAALYTLPAVAAGAWFFGPLGALAGKLAADTLTAVLKLGAARRFVRLGWSDLYLWKETAGVVALGAAGAVLARLAVEPLGWGRFGLLAAGFALDAGFVLAGYALVARRPFVLKSAHG